MEDKLVVLAEFSGETEAHIAQGFLESCGITTYVLSGGANLRNFVLGADIAKSSRIKLMVSPSDLQDAGKLLRSRKEA